MCFDTVEYGKRIAYLRKERGISQERLADELGISRVHLAYIEIGQRTGSIDFMLNITEYFDISLDYLITGEDRFLSKIQDTVRRAISILNDI